MDRGDTVASTLACHLVVMCWVHIEAGLKHGLLLPARPDLKLSTMKRYVERYWDQYNINPLGAYYSINIRVLAPHTYYVVKTSLLYLNKYRTGLVWGLSVKASWLGCGLTVLVALVKPFDLLFHSLYNSFQNLPKYCICHVPDDRSYILSPNLTWVISRKTEISIRINLECRVESAAVNKEAENLKAWNILPCQSFQVVVIVCNITTTMINSRDG